METVGRISSYRYLVLLVTLLLLVVLYPVLRGVTDLPLLLPAILTAVTLVGAWVIFGDHKLRLTGVVLAIPAAVGVWSGYVFPGLPQPAGAMVFHLSAAIFQGFVVIVLLRAAYREETVTVDTISGVLCGYLLIGMAFSHAYGLLEAAAPGSLSGIDAAEGEPEYAELVYFSFITLTTVGYGEITPAAPAARSMCMVEAILGQFYIAVLIAGLVGKSLAQKPPSNDSAAAS